jgi:hypothetical protein
MEAICVREPVIVSFSVIAACAPETRRDARRTCKETVREQESFKRSETHRTRNMSKCAWWARRRKERCRGDECGDGRWLRDSFAIVWVFFSLGAGLWLLDEKDGENGAASMLSKWAGVSRRRPSGHRPTWPIRPAYSQIARGVRNICCLGFSTGPREFTCGEEPDNRTLNVCVVREDVVV